MQPDRVQFSNTLAAAICLLWHNSQFSRPFAGHQPMMQLHSRHTTSTAAAAAAAADLWRLLGAAGKMPLPQAGFLKGMVIDDGTDYLHNDFKGQIDILNSRCVWLARPIAITGATAAE
jgi:hypothetical protein